MQAGTSIKTICKLAPFPPLLLRNPERSHRPNFSRKVNKNAPAPPSGTTRPSALLLRHALLKSACPVNVTAGAPGRIRGNKVKAFVKEKRENEACIIELVSPGIIPLITKN